MPNKKKMVSKKKVTKAVAKKVITKAKQKKKADPEVQVHKIPKVGSVAPQFALPDQNGEVQKLSQYGGGWVLLYFYPKDDTPGCTKEACGIRDSFPAFKKLGITVFGVSTDSVRSHKKFEEKYGLPFTLLADEQKVVVARYGVWGKKKFMGREYLGVLRTSFLINPAGKIAQVYENVNPVLHAEAVLDDLKRLMAIS